MYEAKKALSYILSRLPGPLPGHQSLLQQQGAEGVWSASAAAASSPLPDASWLPQATEMWG